MRITQEHRLVHCVAKDGILIVGKAGVMTHDARRSAEGRDRGERGFPSATGPNIGHEDLKLNEDHRGNGGP
jgi:hypothetical protein